MLRKNSTETVQKQICEAKKKNFERILSKKKGNNNKAFNAYIKTKTIKRASVGPHQGYKWNNSY